MGFFSATYFGGGGGTGGTGGTGVGAISGEIEVELFIADDYSGLSWTVDVPIGTTVGGSSCSLKFVQCSGSCEAFEIEFEGTITDAGSGQATLSFDMANADTSTIAEGEYFFYVTWIGDAEEVYTQVFNRQLVNWKAKAA